MEIPISEVALHHHLQPRETMNRQVIDKYEQAYERDGSTMPALVVFNLDGVYHLVDGFHRLEAAKQAGLAQINIEVIDGTYEDARRFICSANATHGLRRTTADKRRQVQIALETDPQWSNRKIARHCGVDEATVRHVRKSASAEIPQTAERQAIRGGTTYTMDTTSIGRSPQMVLDTMIPRGDIEERYGQSIQQSPPVTESANGASAEIPQSASDAFDVTSESTDWDRWTWDTATGLSLEQVTEKLTASDLDTCDWLITGGDNEAARHLMIKAAQAGYTVYLKPHLTLVYEAPMRPTLEPEELPVQATLPDPVADVAPEPSDWETQITEWLECTGKMQTSFEEIADNCLQLPEDERTHSLKIQMAKLLRSLGWAPIGQKPWGDTKVATWRAPK